METIKKTEGYHEAVGRRKTSVARVRLSSASKMSFLVNEKDIAVYFPTNELQLIVKDPFVKGKTEEKYKVTVRVEGGGIHSQAEAVRHGIARVLTEINPEMRKDLKKADLLKRDPRMKERRKFGLRKARKSKQWSKR